MILRRYQTDSITNLRDSLGKGNRKPLLQLPTGGGKTIIAQEIIKSATGKGKKVLFLAPRRELVYQAFSKFSVAKINCGMVMAGESMRYAPVQVASFDTVNVRCMRYGNDLPPADLVVVDEAHLSIAPTRLKILDWYAASGAVVIGLTATPVRGDGKGLEAFYDDLILSSSITELTAAGYLSPLRYFAFEAPDLSKVPTGAHGDYVTKQLAEAMDTIKLAGDIVTNWKRIAYGKSTVVFCTNQAHSRHVCNEFLKHGIEAEHIDSNTPTDERKEILQRVAAGQTTVLCNVYIASYGLDIPLLEVAVIARPTKSLGLYLQTVGRVLRPYKGKEYATLIDHSGVIDEHGFISSDWPWSLDDQTSISHRRRQMREERREPKEITCGDCGSVFISRRDCPTCGYEVMPRTEAIPTYEANLTEVHDPASKEWNRKTPWDEKIKFYSELLGYAANKNYAPGWAAVQYHERAGVWPNDARLKNAKAITPSDELLGWIKYIAIKKNFRRTAA